MYSDSRISIDELDEDNYVGVDNLLQNKAGKTISNYLPSSGNYSEYRENDILIGNIRPYLKKIWMADNCGGANADVLVIRLSNEGVLPKYLYYLLSSDKFFSYNMQHAKGSKMPRGSKQAIMNYSIPVPSIEEQSRVIGILDKFSRLTFDLQAGLPGEIALRQKQYEYYRDQLLSFKALKSEEKTDKIEPAIISRSSYDTI